MCKRVVSYLLLPQSSEEHNENFFDCAKWNKSACHSRRTQGDAVRDTIDPWSEQVQSVDVKSGWRMSVGIVWVVLLLSMVKGWFFTSAGGTMCWRTWEFYWMMEKYADSLYLKSFFEISLRRSKNTAPGQTFSRIVSSVKIVWWESSALKMIKEYNFYS